MSSVPGGALDEESLRAHFLGRTAYRRTRFIVVRQGPRVAVVAVQKTSEEPLFSPITGLQLLVGPDDCAYVEDPEVDTAVPTALARAAALAVPGRRGVVVMGRYGHVSFIIDPEPLRITVQEVAPPYPPKLLDQAQRVVALAEELHPSSWSRTWSSSTTWPGPGARGATCSHAAAAVFPSRVRPPTTSTSGPSDANGR